MFFGGGVFWFRLEVFVEVFCGEGLWLWAGQTSN